jgi:hypothetical protein
MHVYISMYSYTYVPVYPEVPEGSLIVASASVSCIAVPKSASLTTATNFSASRVVVVGIGEAERGGAGADECIFERSTCDDVLGTIDTRILCGCGKAM